MSTKKKAEEKQAAEEPKPTGGFGGAGQEPADPYAHRKFIVHEKPHMALPKEKP